MSNSNIPPAIFAIGRNYSEHAKEMGGVVDPNPIIFMKNPASVITDGQAIVIPTICQRPGPQVDWEGLRKQRAPCCVLRDYGRARSD